MSPARPSGLPLLLLLTFLLASWPLSLGLEVTSDDGYYYFEIARHLAAGHGSTFDGLHPTNGYHPLWLLCLLPVFALTPTPAAAALVAGLFQALLLTLAAACIYRTARRMAWPGEALVALLLWIDLTWGVWLAGLELALHAACLTAGLWYYLRHFRTTLPQHLAPYVTLGLLTAATLLARLDTALWALTLGIALFVRLRRTHASTPGLRAGLAFALPPSLALLTYAAINLLRFGHPWPVSAAVKAQWSKTLLAQDPLFQTHGWLAAKAWHLATADARAVLLGLAAVIAWCGIMAWGRRWKALRSLRDAVEPLAPLVVYSALHTLACGLLYHGSLSFKPWYFVAQPLLAGLMAAALLRWAVERAKDQPRRWATALSLVLVFVLAAHTLRGQWLRWRHHLQGLSAHRAAAQWVSQNLPTDARLGAWNAGTLAWYAERPVVNLDGLVNSWAYFERDRFDLCRYARETGITHFVDAFHDGAFWSIVPTAPHYAACADRLELLWSDDTRLPTGAMRVYKLPTPKGL